MASNKRKPRGWCYKPGAPLIRGFDTLQLYQKDTLARYKWLSDGVADSQRKIEKSKRKLSKRERRDRNIKKELRAINRTLEKTKPGRGLPRTRQRLLETAKITLSWNDFFKLCRKYPERVLTNMHSGRLVFADTSVILHIPFSPLDQPSKTLIH